MLGFEPVPISRTYTPLPLSLEIEGRLCRFGSDVGAGVGLRLIKLLLLPGRTCNPSTHFD